MQSNINQHNVMYLVTGANLFGQWLSERRIFNVFQDVSLCNKNYDLTQSQLQCITWSYNIFKKGNQFFLAGSWQGKENQQVKIILPDGCAVSDNLLVVGNDYNLLLINPETYNMWIMSLESEKFIKKLSLKVEEPLPKENTAKRLKKEDKIQKVVATNNTCLCLTEEGVVYSGLLPSLVDTSHCEGKVADIQCGYEHFILLTDIGRVYTWGNGRRLQLGHGCLTNMESPTEVEALAGIKIIKISAGGWHSLALSEFGDVYAWGWNDTGQLGIKPQLENKNGVLKKDGISSHHTPMLVDIYDDNGEVVNVNVKDIACGSRHSAILLIDYSIWTAGSNMYGQLGFSPEECQSVKSFKKCFTCKGDAILMCGPWCTVLADNTKLSN